MFNCSRTCTRAFQTHSRDICSLVIIFLRLINHFYYAWSAFLRHVTTPEQSYSSFCAWSIIFITLDQRCLVDTPDQSHVSMSEQSCSLFEFDQSFLSRLISVNPGRRMINHMCLRLNNHVPHLRLINQFYCAWSTLFRGHAWSITCTYAWTVMFLIYAWSIISITPDQCN